MYRVIQNEWEFVHAYFAMLQCTVGAQTGGKILFMPEHFKIFYRWTRKPIYKLIVTVSKIFSKIEELKEIGEN